jgi:predicted component of type VI protein secretion system
MHVSREHARVWAEGGKFYIEDAGSRYGVYVNGAKLVEKMPLTNGAQIKIGEVEMVFKGAPAVAEDLRATTFEPAALDKTHARRTKLKPEGGGKAPTQVIPEEAVQRLAGAVPAATLPATEAGQTEDASLRRTRVGSGAAAKRPEDEEIRHTRVKSDPAAAPPDDEEIRRTRVRSDTAAAPADGEEETRHTRLKPDAEDASPDDEEARHTKVKPE